MHRVPIPRQHAAHTASGDESLQVVEGTVSGLQRISDVEDGADMGASTMHVCIFELDGRRVQLGGWSPPPIADGDKLRVVGHVAEGLFDGIMCRNLSTGWITPAPQKSFLNTPGFLIVCISLIIAIALSLFIGWFAVLIPAAAVFLSIHMAAQPSSGDLAREMLMR